MEKKTEAPEEKGKSKQLDKAVDGYDPSNLPEEQIEEGELLDSLPSEVREQVIGIMHKHYSGPIPDAKSLKKYENVLPGSADRIIKMAEERQVHVKDMEQKVSDHDYDNFKRGQRFAFGSVILFVGLAGYMVFKGHPAAAGTVIGLVLLGIVGVFVTGKKFDLKNSNGKPDQGDQNHNNQENNSE